MPPNRVLTPPRSHDDLKNQDRPARGPSWSAMAHPRVRTGIEGLDDVLNGGLPKDRLFLLTGDPGTGKTTLAMQFLIEGVRNGERSLYVTLSETAEELRAAA